MRVWPGSLLVLPGLFACVTPDPMTSPTSTGDLLARVGNPGGRRCAALQVSPESATIPIGGQVALDATAFNKLGNPIPSATVAWTTRNVNVAAVSSSGLVTGVGTGSTYVVAVCEPAHGDSAFITVAP
jgi:hypothetical protein